MQIPQVEGIQRRVMADDSKEEVGKGGPGLRDFESPHEIESADPVAGVSDRNVDSSAGTSISEVGGAVAGSPTVEISGDAAVRRLGDLDSNISRDISGVESRNQEDRSVSRHIGNDPSSLGTAEKVGTTGTQSRYPVAIQSERGTPLDKSRDTHYIDIPAREHLKIDDVDDFKGFAIARTTSNFSVESGTGDQCRICQQHTDETLMELGCHCRGELAKAHRSCVDHWFGNKGTNKCEVCQHVATNVPLPASQPSPHFWVWRVGGPYNAAAPRHAGVGPLRLNPLPMRPVLLMTLRRHPTIMVLWLLLFSFMAYLFVDVTDSASIGYAAMPIGFLFGVLVVLGLGTAARLILECWHERAIRRNIQLMEEEPNFEEIPAQQNSVNIQLEPIEGQSSTNVPPISAPVQTSAGGTSNMVPTT